MFRRLKYLCCADRLRELRLLEKTPEKGLCINPVLKWGL